MTKLNNLSPEATPSTKTGRSRKSQALPEDKWNPNKPFHVTPEEFLNHIHEIEKGPFIPVEECFKNVRVWMKEQGKSLL